jgi:hypothetical protein
MGMFALKWEVVLSREEMERRLGDCMFTSEAVLRVCRRHEV